MPNNSSTTSSELTPQDIVAVTLFSLVCVVGVVGNSLVICVYSFSVGRRFLKFEQLVLMLAIVDLISCITNPFLNIYVTTTKRSQWHFGHVGCKVLPSVGPMFTNISLGIILIMAIDRDRSVHKRMREQFKIKTIYKAVGVTVVLSVLVCVPHSYHHISIMGTCGIFTEKVGPGYFRYVLALFLTSDILFILILATTTRRICLKLTKLRMARCVSLKLIDKDRQRQTKKIVNVILSIGIAFVVLIFPRDILQMLATIDQLLSSFNIEIKTFYFLSDMLKFLHTSNSSINVFVYSVFSSRFRKKLSNLLKRSSHIRRLLFLNSETSNELSIRSSRRKEPYQTSRYSWKPSPGDSTEQEHVLTSQRSLDLFKEKYVLCKDPQINTTKVITTQKSSNEATICTNSTDF